MHPRAGISVSKSVDEDVLLEEHLVRTLYLEEGQWLMIHLQIPDLSHYTAIRVWKKHQQAHLVWQQFSTSVKTSRFRLRDLLA